MISCYRMGWFFSPSMKVELYINDSRREFAIRAFDLLPSGMLAKHTDRVFADLRGDEPGVPDGMKVDAEGNVLVEAPADYGSSTPTARNWAV